MEKRFEKGTEERIRFFDYWEFCQKCYAPQTDEEWEQLIREGDELIKKHNSSEYVLDLVKAHISDCERRSNGKKKM